MAFFSPADPAPPPPVRPSPAARRIGPCIEWAILRQHLGSLPKEAKEALLVQLGQCVSGFRAWLGGRDGTLGPVLGRLPPLTRLELEDDAQMTRLPESVVRLATLAHLKLKNCTPLATLP